MSQTLKLVNNKIVRRLFGLQLSCNCCGDPNLGCGLQNKDESTNVRYLYEQAQAFVLTGGTVRVQTQASFELSAKVQDPVFDWTHEGTISGSFTSYRDFQKISALSPCRATNEFSGSTLFIEQVETQNPGQWDLTTTFDDGSQQVQSLSIAYFSEPEFDLQLFRDTPTRRHFMQFEVDQTRTAINLFTATVVFGFLLGSFRIIGTNSVTFNGKTNTFGSPTVQFVPAGPLISSSGSGQSHITITYIAPAP